MMTGCWRTIVIVSFMSSTFLDAVNICSVQPSATVVIVEERVSLNCAANGDYSIQSWQLLTDVQNRTLIYRGQEFGPNGNITKHKFVADGYSVSNVADNYISLHIDQIKFFQAGLYACQCNDPTRSIATTVVVVLAKEPTFSISTNIAHGKPVSFSCNISFSGSTGISSKLMINDTSRNIVNRTNCSSNNVPTSCILKHTITAKVSVDQSHTCSVQLMSNNTTIYSRVFNRTLMWQQVSWAEIVVSNPQRCSSKKCVVGESIKCKTDGNAEITVFRWWQSRINSSALPIGDGSQFLALNDIGQFTYQCQAYTIIQHVTYNVTSKTFAINVTEDDSRHSDLPIIFVAGISVSVGVVAIVVAIVVTRIILCSRKQKSRRSTEAAYATLNLKTPEERQRETYTAIQFPLQPEQSNRCDYENTNYSSEYIEIIN